ncbi:hypothetical protein GCM10009016_13290 [Halomonas beimenensis]
MQGLGWPSVANPLGGKSIHRMFFFFRLAHGKRPSLHLAPGADHDWVIGKEFSSMLALVWSHPGSNDSGTISASPS